MAAPRLPGSRQPLSRLHPGGDGPPWRNYAIAAVAIIDAVGRTRGAGMGGGHDEREQTLNQILAASASCSAVASPSGSCSTMSPRAPRRTWTTPPASPAAW